MRSNDEQKKVLEQIQRDRKLFSEQGSLNNGTENVMGVLNFTFSKTYNNLQDRYGRFINNAGPIDQERCVNILAEIRNFLLWGEGQRLEGRIKEFSEKTGKEAIENRLKAQDDLKKVKTALRGLGLFNHKKYLKEQEAQDGYFGYTIIENNTYEGNPVVPDLLYLMWCAATDKNITTSTVEARQYAFIVGLERATRSHNREDANDPSLDDGKEDKKACSLGFMGMILEVFSVALHAEHPDVVFAPALNEKLGEDAKKCLWKIFNAREDKKTVYEAWMAKKPTEDQRKLIEEICVLTRKEFEIEIKKYGEPVTVQEKNQLESFMQAQVRNMPYLALPPRLRQNSDEKDEKEGKEVKETQDKVYQEFLTIKRYGLNEYDSSRLDNIGITGPYSTTIGVPPAPMLFPYDPTGNPRLQHKNNGITRVYISGKLPKKSVTHIPKWLTILLIKNGINIQDENALDIFWIAQDRPWHKDEVVLLRPQGWQDPDAPQLARGEYSQKLPVSVALFGLNGKVTQDDMVSSVLHTHKDVHSPIVVFSKDQFPILGIEDTKETHCFYSVCIDKSKKRAAITIHWLLNPRDAIEMGRIINNLFIIFTDKISFNDVIVEIAAIQPNRSKLNGFGPSTGEITPVRELNILINGGDRENLEYEAEKNYKVVERANANSLGSEVKRLAEALNGPVCLTSLDLSDNNLTERDMSLLAATLSTSDLITSLNLTPSSSSNAQRGNEIDGFDQQGILERSRRQRSGWDPNVLNMLHQYGNSANGNVMNTIDGMLGNNSSSTSSNSSQQQNSSSSSERTNPAERTRSTQTPINSYEETQTYLTGDRNNLGVVNPNSRQQQTLSSSSSVHSSLAQVHADATRSADAGPPANLPQQEDAPIILHSLLRLFEAEAGSSPAAMWRQRSNSNAYPLMRVWESDDDDDRSDRTNQEDHNFDVDESLDGQSNQSNGSIRRPRRWS